MIQELSELIGVSLLVIDLIATGFIGLIKREIDTKSILFQILFMPLGLVAFTLGIFQRIVYEEEEKGRAAISSSIATIGLGLLIALFFSNYYLGKYKILDDGTLELLITGSLICLIIALLVVIVLVIKQQNGSKKLN